MHRNVHETFEQYEHLQNLFLRIKMRICKDNKQTPTRPGTENEIALSAHFTITTVPRLVVVLWSLQCLTSAPARMNCWIRMTTHIKRVR